MKKTINYHFSGPITGFNIIFTRLAQVVDVSGFIKGHSVVASEINTQVSIDPLKMWRPLEKVKIYKFTSFRLWFKLIFCCICMKPLKTQNVNFHNVQFCSWGLHKHFYDIPALNIKLYVMWAFINIQLADNEHPDLE